MNMLKHLFFFIPLFCLLSLNVWCQNKITYSSSEILSIPRAAVINPLNVKIDWFVNLQNIEKANPEMTTSELQQIKATIPAKKSLSYSFSPQLISQPVLQNSFEGNRFNKRVPNDNDIAISNDSKIVTVTNSIIYFYNSDNSLIDTLSLETFASDLNMLEGKYDPRVIYDPLTDRFIMVFLNGFDDSTSFAIVAFSKTNDPTDDWNVYSLSGNPLHDTSWSDFPMIAINEKELFITFNLLKNDIDWKTGFKQTIAWQIDKNSGYTGVSLKTRLYSNINFNGKRLRNLCPVQGGSKPIGDHMYFLSNKNFSVNTDSFFIGEITGTLNDTSLKLNMNVGFSDIHYGVPPSADQPLNRLSETNDARVLDAYIENGDIYFVGNSINFDNNQASIYHGKVSVANPANIKLFILKDAKLEFGYPSIAYTGTTWSPDESIILFDHTSSTVYPGVSCLFYKNGEYSDILRIKEGKTSIFVQSGKNQRWGDYTGLQRKYNEYGVVWGSGYFGKYDSLGTLTRVNGTWISKLVSPTYNSIKDRNVSVPSIVKTYPNPINKDFTIEFDCQHTSVFEFQLYDGSGKQIKLLLRNLVYAGKNVFSFNTEPLNAGIYYLIIKSKEEKVTQKLFIE
jgi:hypothetical protein